MVSGTWFDTLGLNTSLGRGLTVGDDLLPGAHPVVVLTYDYWKSRFNGNSAVLNQTVLINGHPMTLIGVTAPRISRLRPRRSRGRPGSHHDESRDDAHLERTLRAARLWLQLVGRLRPGVSPHQAQASMEPYYHGLLIMEMQP